MLLGNEISRKHGEIQIDGPLITLVDLDSRNGTFVNGQRITRAVLRSHDIVRCGEWIGVVDSVIDTLGFREISPDWFGGSRLSEAIEPATRIQSELAIIIQGETGTGKEGAAQAIHRWSNRRGSFVAVNCAALPEQLAESALFGHKKGAFSGAEKASLGLFRAAEGGTLFLDEILELPRSIQAKLLRAIEQREVLPLGETQPVPVDVRIVTATQESLSTAVKDDRFRADLLARLDGLTVVLPPLRERREDIIPLFLQFIRQQASSPVPSLDAKLAESLCIYDWPLNVRELAILTRRLLDLHGQATTLKRSHLPDRMQSISQSPSKVMGEETVTRPKQSTKDDEQFEALVAALRDHEGNVAKAAAALGLNRHRAYRLLTARPEFSRVKLGAKE